MPTRSVRTLFISDVHLGTRGSQAEQLLEFLRTYEAEALFLVGDIVDCWRLKKAWYWPQSHNDVVQKVLRKARKGTRVVYIPGNHDEILRDYTGTHFGGIEVRRDAIYETLAGERLKVLHGDEFDIVVRHARWLALMGDWAYDLALWVSTWLNMFRRRLGLPYWSLSAWAKFKVKRAVNFIGAYEEAVVKAAHRDNTDGIICGHIHHAAIHERFGIKYLNCGDWVESCTALAEHYDGRFELIRWTEMVGLEEAILDGSEEAIAA